MTTFLLIRHAENDYVKKGRLAGRLPGVHLNAKGRQQAQTLAETLATTPIHAIYSSPLERAIETATPLAQKLGLPVIPHAGLLETDLGQWQGRSIKVLQRTKAWHQLQTAPSHFQFPGGESIQECQARLVAEIEALRALHTPDQIVACVSHADPLKQLVGFYIDLPPDNFHCLAVDPASVTVLQIGPGPTRLLVLNYVPAFAFQPPPAKR